MPHTDGPCSAAKYEHAVGFVVEDQVDLALAIQVHVFGTMGRDLGEAHDLEDRLQGVGVGDANSMNSKPIRPIGFSYKSAMVGASSFSCQLTDR